MVSNGYDLNGKRVAVLAADGFEYVELSIPVAALRAAGAQTEVVSLHGGRIRGMNLTEPTLSVSVDRTLDAAHAAEYDALLLPGGFISPDFLRQSRLAREFVAAFDRANKPIATLCHGPWVLISAELVLGRRLAGWPGIRDDVVHAGGVWRDEPVVRDGNWVTSRGPQDMTAFVEGMLECFAGHDESRAATPLRDEAASKGASSPRRVEPPSVALFAARMLPGPALPAMAGLAAGAALGALVASRAVTR
jgi:deglycase